MIRSILLLAFLALLAAASDGPPLRGKLVQRDGKPPAIETAPGKLVAVEGEPETITVLSDSRLSGADVELAGRFTAADRFAVGPFYQAKSMFVHKDGRKYTISYWCQVCSIRTYTPGTCMCCQKETELSLEEYSQ